MTADRQRAFASVRVPNPEDGQACALVCADPDVVVREGRCARRWDPAEESSHRVIAARRLGATGVEGLPGPASSNPAIFTRVKCAGASQSDL